MTELTNYYVTNPTPDVVVVGGKSVGPWTKEPVFISHDEAVKLLGAGWGIIQRNVDVEAGLSSDSAMPLVQIADNQILDMTHANKIVDITGKRAYMPNHSSVPYSLGTVITFVTREGLGGKIYRNAYAGVPLGRARRSFRRRIDLWLRQYLGYSAGQHRRRHLRGQEHLAAVWFAAVRRRLRPVI